MDSSSSVPLPAPGAASLPPIIQGGMGVGVSGWRLARAVSRLGQLGVVSGTALDGVLARSLQSGDPGGHFRRALAAFPFPELSQRVLARYFREDGTPVGEGFRPHPMMSEAPARAALELMVAAAFCAVYLAREDHDGAVGINLLEKIQTPTLAALYGAMLAGVGVVIMGAGIPRQIPGILDRLAAGEAAEMRLDVTGSKEAVVTRIDPRDFSADPPSLARPVFLAVVSSPILAENLRRKASGRVDGFIIEAPTAGGHNAPPRGPMVLSAGNEPVYGPRDAIDPAAFLAIGLPFWLAGGYGRPGRLADALAAGAQGIQAGTVFAFCNESGFAPEIKNAVLRGVREGTLTIHTDAKASPTGFPFKVARLPGTLADPAVFDARNRVCDLGVLRESYRREDGSVGFRCAAEPVDDYVRKGGDPEQAVGRMCLCNSLFAAIGLAQTRDGIVEPPLVTVGDDLESIRMMLPADGESYSAADVVERLLAPLE